MRQVAANPSQIHQVLLNLFLNSVDILYEDGKICIEVEEINDFFCLFPL